MYFNDFAETDRQGEFIMKNNYRSKSSDNTIFTAEVISNVYTPDSKTAGYKGSQYPTLVELEHNGEKNGTLLASFEVFASDFSGFPVYRSTDGGESFSPLTVARETIDKSLVNHWEPHLYELPERVGDMPAGTVLLSGTTINGTNDRKSQIAVWRSFDAGESFEEYTVVDIAGGLSRGLWEPFIIYEDGWLYCFYSSEAYYEKHSQVLIYKRSRDGVNWSDPVDVCACDDPTLRPGMISVAKMGNGRFFAAYELVSEHGGHSDRVYYKIADRLDGDWDPRIPGRLLVSKNGSDYIGSAPFCGWTPAGGSCGTLFVTANFGGGQYIYVSFDCGESFEAIDNPLPYTRPTGYSPCFISASDKKHVYYLNTQECDDRFGKVMFAKLKVTGGDEIQKER